MQRVFISELGGKVADVFVSPSARVSKWGPGWLERRRQEVVTEISTGLRVRVSHGEDRENVYKKRLTPHMRMTAKGKEKDKPCPRNQAMFRREPEDRDTAVIGI
jgi:hypothetical protein